MVQNRFLPILLLASSLSGSAVAQTHSDCNPLLAACPNNPGTQEKSITLDFTKLKSLPAGWTTENNGQVNFGPDGAKISVAKPNDSLNIISTFYMLFGSFEFKAKAAPGNGIVSTLVLLSDALDEVDWEVLGAEPNQVQSNYFGKGDDKVFDRGGFHAAPSNQAVWHTYRLDWTPEFIAWSIDGTAVRTLRYSEAKGGTRFPQTPMRIKIGAWAPGDPGTNREGTVAWAKGPVDWSAAPFAMAVASINITNYSPAREYVYGDRTGAMESIRLVDGAFMSNGAVTPPPSPPVSSITSTVSAAPTPIPTSGTIGKITSSMAASSVARNATATLAKPVVATGDSAARAWVASGMGMTALVITALLLL